jgi:two-component system, cell cycle response regulator
VTAHTENLSPGGACADTHCMRHAVEPVEGTEDDLERQAVSAALDDLELVPYDDPAAAEAPALELAQRADALGQLALVHRARLVHADVIGRRGDTAGAGTIARQVNEWATEHDDGHLLARSERLLSAFYSRIGDMSSALEHAVRAVELLAPETRPRLVADHLMGLALAYARTRSFDAARDRFAVILDIADALGDAALRIAALNNLAYIEYWAGEPDAAMRVAEEMQRISRAHGYRLDASLLDTVARAQMLMGDYEAAERTLAPVVGADGEGLAAESDSLAEVLLTLAECQRMIGATDRASASLARSAELCEQRNLEEVRVRVMEEQAAVLAAQGDYRGAYEQHREFHAASEAIFSTERDARARILATVFETEEAVRSSKRFREMSLRDPLTGLYNRRYVDDRVPALLSRSRTHATYLSVAILDLDHFKTVNDELSHDTGDEVLRRLAPLLESGASEDGFAARLGGEEFLVVLPGFDSEQAARRCETLRRVVREHSWREVVGELPVTVSIGVATTFAGAQPYTAMLAEADRCLYAAKRAGRDRVVTA